MKIIAKIPGRSIREVIHIVEMQPQYRTLLFYNNDKMYLKFPWTYFGIKSYKCDNYYEYIRMNIFIAENKIKSIKNGKVNLFSSDSNFSGKRSFCLSDSDWFGIRSEFVEGIPFKAIEHFLFSEFTGVEFSTFNLLEKQINKINSFDVFNWNLNPNILFNNNANNNTIIDFYNDFIESY